ncbi:MAG: hypothetical protein ABI130_04360 [Leifsonia sp.]
MPSSTEVSDFFAQPLRFASTFVSADPKGAAPVERARLAEALPKRKAMFDAAGVGHLTLRSLTETVLDDDYVLAETRWAAPIEGGGEFETAATYILRRTPEGLEVVFYLNHVDVQGRLGALTKTSG